MVDMHKELEKSSIQIDHTLNNDLTSIISVNSSKFTPFINLFWQQQKKLFKCSNKGVRFDPMLIRFCRSLWSKSSSAYEELRNFNVLVLPSSRTLRDYKNFTQSKTGFAKEILNDLTGLSSNFIGNQRYIAIVIDEMKIKINLVFDKHSGELSGFVDLGDPDKNFTSMDSKMKTLASHALVLHHRGICTDLKYSLAYFTTRGVTSTQLFPIF